MVSMLQSTDRDSPTEITEPGEWDQHIQNVKNSGAKLTPQEERIMWHETEGQKGWENDVSMLANTDVPGRLPSEQLAAMSEEEQEIYHAMVNNTRKRQNGEYPGED